MLKKKKEKKKPTTTNYFYYQHFHRVHDGKPFEPSIDDESGR